MIVAVTTAGLVSLIWVLAVNFPAIQRALSVAGIRRAVVKGKFPLEKAIALIRADDDIPAPAEQPPARKRRWRSFRPWARLLRPAHRRSVTPRPPGKRYWPTPVTGSMIAWAYQAIIAGLHLRARELAI